MSTIRELADEAAGELRREFHRDAIGELAAWLLIAAERESLVAAAYAPAFVNTKVDSAGVDPELARTIKVALNGAWAQETAHQAYLGAITASLNTSDAFKERLSASVSRTFGVVKGAVIALRLSPSVTTRLLGFMGLALGRLAEEVPNVLAGVGEMSFKGYCLVNSDLESTAISGYARMVELADRAANRNLTASALPIFLRQTLLDERYHRELFEVVAAKCGPGGELSPAVNVEEFHHLLARLRRRIYDVRSSPAIPVLDAVDPLLRALSGRVAAA